MRCAVVGALVASMLALAGCGGGSGSGPVAGNSSPSSSPPAPPGAPAPPPAPGAASAPAAGATPGAGATAAMPGAGATAAMPGAGATAAMPGAGATTAGAVPMPGTVAMPGVGGLGASAGAATATVPMPGADLTTPMPMGADLAASAVPMPGTGLADVGGTGVGAVPGMAGMPGMPAMGSAGAKRPAKPRSLKELAMDEFRRGNDDKGFELLNTYYAIIPTAGEELGQKMAWNPGLRRPALGPRFAIGVIYNAPSDFKDSPQPVGSDEAEEALAAAQEGSSDGSGKKSRRLGDRRRKGNAGGAAAGAAGVAMPAAGGGIAGMPAMGGGEFGGSGTKADPSAELDFYTGEFGTALLDALKARFSDGAYGLVLQDLVVAAAAPGAKKNNQNADAMLAGAPAMAAGMPPMPGVGGAEIDAAAAVPAADAAVGGEGADAAADEQAPQQLAPAIAWVGTAKGKEELIKRALQSHADVLITYEVAIRPATATKFVNNSTKLRAGAIKPGSDKEEVIFTSAPLNNRTVIEARKKGSGDDPVEKEVGRAIAALDSKFTTTELPAGVTAEAAAGRIQKLVAAAPEDPLPVLVEARFYVEKGLLKQENLMEYSVQLLGEEKFAQMLTTLPGAGAGQMVGDAVSLGGIIGLMRGVNTATDTAEGAAGLKPAAGSPAAPPKAGGGLGSLLPFGLGGGQPQPAATAGDPMPMPVVP